MKAWIHQQTKQLCERCLCPNMVPCHCVFKTSRFPKVEQDPHTMCIFETLAVRHGSCQAPGIPMTRKVSRYVSASDLHSEGSQLKDRSATGSFVFLHHFSCVQRRVCSDFITMAISRFQAPSRHTHKHTLTPSHSHTTL